MANPFDFLNTDRDTVSKPEMFRAKVDFMLKELTPKGYYASTLAPPMYRLAWSFGWHWIPPIFASFWKTTIIMGSAWGILWTLSMWLMDAAGDIELGDVMGFGKIIGFPFGLLMASYYAYMRTQLQLPSWDRYPEMGIDMELDLPLAPPRQQTQPYQPPYQPPVQPAQQIGHPQMGSFFPQIPQQASPFSPQSPAQPSGGSWLAGMWSGTVISQSNQGTHQIPFQFQFDPAGRPIMELLKGQPTTLFQAGQTIGGGSLRFTVTELSLLPDGCRIGLQMLSESFQQYSGVGGVGYASASDASTTTATTQIEFRYQGNGLRIQWQTVTQTSGGMRVLDSYSTGNSGSQMTLEGMLFRQ